MKMHLQLFKVQKYEDIPPPQNLKPEAFPAFERIEMHLQLFKAQRYEDISQP
jgi:hypothetical protein